MNTIDWHETQVRSPREGSIDFFCRENGFPTPETEINNEILAFIEQKALEALHAFLAHDTHREHGGVLIGEPFFDPRYSRHFVVIRTALPAHETHGSPVHMQFTPQSWDMISGIIEESFPDQVIVGWYHSHPGLGVFMSSTDRATQKSFYDHPWSLAVVVDPITEETGWFMGGDCKRMESHHVIPYTEPIETEVGKDHLELTKEEETYSPRLNLDQLRWLLPVTLLTVLLLFTLWFLNRNRL